MLQLLFVYLSVRLLIGSGFEIVSVYHKLSAADAMQVRDTVCGARTFFTM